MISLVEKRSNRPNGFFGAILLLALFLIGGCLEPVPFSDETGARATTYITTAIPPGAICENGGWVIDTGFDSNANAVLDTWEITDSFTICNGAPGADGNTPPTIVSYPSAGWPTSAIHSALTLVEGVACPAAGGSLFVVFDDSDGTAGLSSGDAVISQLPVCDGADAVTSPFTRAEWVSAADWVTATTVTLTMTGTGATLSYVFSTSGDNTLSLTAGQPYILQIINPATADAKHYLSTKPNMGAVSMPGDFYQAIATRKVQTADAEYKAPYFKALELLLPGTETMVELYFIPVLTGTYYIYCQQPGHEAAGMLGNITITGDDTLQLDLGVDPLFDTSLLNPPAVFSGADWTTAEGLAYEVFMTEEANGGLCAGADTFCYTGSAVTLLNAGLTRSPLTPYVITLRNTVGNAAKHYFTAPDFYQSIWTRKAMDSHGEIKVPYFDAIELRSSAAAETSTALYFSPVFGAPSADGFSAYCTVGTHAVNGMNTLIK